MDGHLNHIKGLEKIEKILTFLKLFFNLLSLCTVIWDFDIMYYLT